MSVREHDLTTLAEHMYDKAHLMGACTDQGITIQKTINPKIELDRFIASCVATHLKFAQEQQRRTFVDNNLPLTSEERLNSDFQKLQYDRCMMQSSRPVLQGKVNPPYEFLKVEPMYLPKNYLSRKRCFDSSRN